MNKAIAILLFFVTIAVTVMVELRKWKVVKASNAKREMYKV